MLGPAVQFREFKLPLGTHWKDNKHFYKGIFLLDWSGEQINNSEKRQILRQGGKMVVLNLPCKHLRTSEWLYAFSQSWWDQILSQVVILGMRVSWINENRSALLQRVWPLVYLCLGGKKSRDITIWCLCESKGFHSRRWNSKHFGPVNLFRWL